MAFSAIAEVATLLFSESVFEEILSDFVPLESFSIKTLITRWKLNIANDAYFMQQQRFTIIK